MDKKGLIYGIFNSIRKCFSQEFSCLYDYYDPD